MLIHALIMISDLRSVIPAFFADHGAHHIHLSGNPWLGTLRAASRHIVIIVQYR